MTQSPIRNLNTQTTLNLQTSAAPGRRPRTGARDELLGPGLRLSGAHGADQQGPHGPGGTCDSLEEWKRLHDMPRVVMGVVWCGEQLALKGS